MGEFQSQFHCDVFHPNVHECYGLPLQYERVGCTTLFRIMNASVVVNLSLMIRSIVCIWPTFPIEQDVSNIVVRT